MTERSARKAIVIVGGGASGVILAAHLLRDPDAPVRVTIIERRGEMGQGIAYSTRLPDHILNVSALGMSAFADDPEHFLRWLVARGLADAANPRIYVQRRLYGEYLAEIFSDLAAREGDAGRLHMVAESGLGLATTPSGVEVRLANGTSVVGHAAVLAVGHEPVSTAGFGRAIRPGSAEDTPLSGDETVLILGTGLSMVDTWQSLDRAGHRGPVIALSRRGLLPAVHRQGKPVRLDSADVPLGTDLSYFMRWLRDLIRATERAGGDWRDVVDGLRPFNQAIWRSWSAGARRRFIEHTRAWWEIHRHRMPPELSLRVEEAVAGGRLSLVAGRLAAVQPEDGSLRVRIRPRNGSEPMERTVGRIYDCTGIASDLSTSSNAILRDLIQRGLARPDAMRLGLDVTTDCALVGRDGTVVDRLYAVGPLTRGTFFEIDAVPDIRQQCADLAATLMG